MPAVQAAAEKKEEEEWEGRAAAAVSERAPFARAAVFISFKASSLVFSLWFTVRSGLASGAARARGCIDVDAVDGHVQKPGAEIEKRRVPN